MGTFEHRKLIRANIVLKVIYKTMSKPQLEGFAFSKDLSTTGINIIMPDKLKEATELELQIYFLREKEPIIAKGKVVWQAKCSYISNGKKQYYSTGVQFTDMSNEYAVKTSEFVKNILKKQSDVQTQKIIDKIENKEDS